MAISAEKSRRVAMKLNGETLAKGTMRSVPVAVIKLDPKYQRDTKQTWVDNAGSYDPNLATTVVLSSRAGGPWCIDGGHRIALARANGVSHINAFVIDGLSQVDEARLFVRLQRMRTALTSHPLYRAERLFDPETQAMERVVNVAGFRLAAKAGNGPNVITAIDSVRYIHRYGGDDLLSRTLGFVKELWIGEDKALSGPVLKGLALFLFAAGQQPSFRRDRLVSVMQAHGPMKVTRLAQTIAEKRNSVSAGPANFAEALLTEYNKLVRKGEEPLPPLTIGNKRRPKARNA